MDFFYMRSRRLSRRRLMSLSKRFEFLGCQTYRMTVRVSDDVQDIAGKRGTIPPKLAFACSAAKSSYLLSTTGKYFLYLGGADIMHLTA
jgi:hypothetical protein